MATPLANRLFRNDPYCRRSFSQTAWKRTGLECNRGRRYYFNGKSNFFRLDVKRHWRSRMRILGLAFNGPNHKAQPGDIQDLDNSEINTENNELKNKQKKGEDLGELDISVTAHEVAMLYKKCIESQKINFELLNVLANHVLKNKVVLSEFTLRAISETIQSLGKIFKKLENRKNGLENCKELVSALLVEGVERNLFINIKQMEENWLPGIILGVAFIFEWDRGSTFKTISEKIVDLLVVALCSEIKLIKLNHENLVNFLVGCVHLGYDDSDDVIELIIKEIQGRLQDDYFNLMPKHESENVLDDLNVPKGFSAKNVSDILHACGKLGIELNGGLKTLPKLAKYYATKFNECELANIVHACSTLGASENDVLDKLAVQIVTLSNNGDLNDPKCLAKLVHGFGKMGYFELTMHEVLIGCIAQNLIKFTGNELSEILYGLGILRVKGRTKLTWEFMNGTIKPFITVLALYMQSPRILHSMNCSTLCSTFWSFAKLQYVDESFYDLFINAYFAKENGSFAENARQIGVLIGSCAVVNYPNEKLRKYMEKWAAAGFDGCSSVRGITSVMGSMAVLGMLNIEQFEFLANKLMEIRKNRTLPISQLRRVMQSWCYLKFIQKCPECLECSAQSTELVNMARVALTSNQSTMLSRFENELHGYLTELGIEFSVNEYIEDVCISVDILLKQYSTVIELDGPWHYALTTKNGNLIPLGRTVFRNKVLEASGYKVVTVSYLEWESTHRNNRKDLISHILESHIK